MAFGSDVPAAAALLYSHAMEASVTVGAVLLLQAWLGAPVLIVAAVLTAAREVDAAVRATSSLALLSTVADVREQLGRLVHDGFVAEAGAARLPHLVRYLRGALHRLAKAAENPGRDEGLAWQVHELEDAHRAALTAARSGAPQPAREEGLAAVPWMLEELRVSLFAQHLGTAHPVSPKRIRTAIAG